jgi:hypothetical protein
MQFKHSFGMNWDFEVKDSEGTMTHSFWRGIPEATLVDRSCKKIRGTKWGNEEIFNIVVFIRISLKKILY